MSFIVVKKPSPSGLILIVTDAELVGKKFSEGKRQLDLRQKFYQGQEMSEKEVSALFPAAYILHLTGERAVALAISAGWVQKENVLVVQSVPHAEVILG